MRIEDDVDEVEMKLTGRGTMSRELAFSRLRRNGSPSGGADLDDRLRLLEVEQGPEARRDGDDRSRISHGSCKERPVTRRFLAGLVVTGRHRKSQVNGMFQHSATSAGMGDKRFITRRSQV